MKKCIAIILIVWSFLFLLVPNISKASESYNSAKNSWKVLSRNLLSSKFKNTTSAKIKLNRIEIGQRFLIEADNILIDFLREKLNKTRTSNLSEDDKVKIDTLLSEKIVNLNNIKVKIEASKDKSLLKMNATNLLSEAQDAKDKIDKTKSDLTKSTISDLVLRMLINIKIGQIEINKLTNEKKVLDFSGDLSKIKDQLLEVQNENESNNFVKAKDLLKQAQKSFNDLAVLFQKEEEAENEK